MVEIAMVPGRFVIFYPDDGHMPGVRSQDPLTRKVVLKLRRDALP